MSKVIGPVVLDIRPEPFAPGDTGDFASRRRDLFALDQLEQQLGVPVVQVRRIRGKLELLGCTRLEQSLIAPAPTSAEPFPVLFEAACVGDGCNDGMLRVPHVDLRAGRFAAFAYFNHVELDNDLRLDGAVINGFLLMSDVTAGGDIDLGG
jgi:hypothetical protein